MNHLVDILRFTPVPVLLALIGTGAMMVLILMLKREAGDNLIEFLSGLLSLFREKHRRP